MPSTLKALTKTRPPVPRTRAQVATIASSPHPSLVFVSFTPTATRPDTSAFGPDSSRLASVSTRTSCVPLIMKAQLIDLFFCPYSYTQGVASPAHETSIAGEADIGVSGYSTCRHRLFQLLHALSGFLGLLPIKSARLGILERSRSRRTLSTCICILFVRISMDSSIPVPGSSSQVGIQGGGSFQVRTGTGFHVSLPDTCEPRHRRDDRTTSRSTFRSVQDHKQSRHSVRNDGCRMEGGTKPPPRGCSQIGLLRAPTASALCSRRRPSPTPTLSLPLYVGRV